MRNEVVVGGSDHALYSINVNDPNCRPVTMYNKSNGHTDWVTTVTHLADGKVTLNKYCCKETCCTVIII